MDSLIFDLDGTLWDSTDVVVTAWNGVLKRYKEVKKEITAADLKGIMGLQVKEAGKILFPEVEEAIQRQLMRECCEVECHYLSQQGGRLYPDLEKVLHVLSKKYKLFIVSNC